MIGLEVSNVTIVKVSHREKRGTNWYTWFTCLCKCGETCVVAQSVLSGVYSRHGRKGEVSCGCHLKDRAKVSAHRLRFQTYKDGAVKRKLPFALTLDEFNILSTQDCHYCGQEPVKWTQYTNIRNGANRRKGHNTRNEGDICINGIDRKDSKEGYSILNCVTACTTCNLAKQSLDYEDFIAWVHRASFHLTKTGD
jgi:hypothetical protein